MGEDPLEIAPFSYLLLFVAQFKFVFVFVFSTKCMFHWELSIFNTFIIYSPFYTQ